MTPSLSRDCCATCIGLFSPLSTLKTEKTYIKNNIQRVAPLIVIIGRQFMFCCWPEIHSLLGQKIREDWSKNQNRPKLWALFSVFFNQQRSFFKDRTFRKCQTNFFNLLRSYRSLTLTCLSLHL